MLGNVAAFSVRHRWLVVLTWLVLVAGVTVAGQTYGGSFSNDLSVEDTDSQAAYASLERKFPDQSGDGMQVVLHDRHRVTTAKIQREVEAALDIVREQQSVASAESPYGPHQ